ncbi:uncharacterized protein LOC109723345 [Ananas comosus]|uniref:Uncharacterized protein LOC109723345 n=1 Tax=Ananas comosus TaxID=4615 RepID=A0A6P5GF50_ANACO|nr:uncharacterized protein LOC109723345 [Ananas comosus]
MGFKPSKKEPLNPPPLESSPSANPSLGAVAGPVEESSAAAMEIDEEEEDKALAGAAALARAEVLRRRSRRRKQLIARYRRQYWAMVEEVRVKHRTYYWVYGKGPVDAGRGGGGGGEEERGRGEGERKRCAFAGVQAMAMPLTRFCHAHILRDPNRRSTALQFHHQEYRFLTYPLYGNFSKGISSNARTGQIICGKPILVAAAPSLCHVHLQRVQKSIAQGLKKTGLNMSSSSKTISKFTVLIADCVRQIQSKRRKSLNASVDKIASKDEKLS